MALLVMPWGTFLGTTILILVRKKLALPVLPRGIILDHVRIKMVLPVLTRGIFLFLARKKISLPVLSRGVTLFLVRKKDIVASAATWNHSISCQKEMALPVLPHVIILVPARKNTTLPVMPHGITLFPASVATWHQHIFPARKKLLCHTVRKVFVIFATVLP
jgi:hypothetical protein